MNQNHVWHYLDLTLQQDWLEAALNVCWESGSTGIEEDVPLSGWYRIYFADLAARDHAHRILPITVPALIARLEIHTGSVEDPGWRLAWHKFFNPAEIGRKFLILPSWEPVPETSRLILRVHPGQAFGTGYHETTTLCLQHLESLDLEGHSILDAGCGSGILGIAAILAGAQTVLGIDIETEAVLEAGQNAQINNVHQHCRWAMQSVESVDGKFDGLLGNLQTGLLLDLHRKLIELVYPSGFLILSGFLVSDRDHIVEAFESSGLVAEYVLEELGEWSSIMIKRIG